MIKLWKKNKTKWNNSQGNPEFVSRIQAGQYSDAHEMLNDLLKLEEESLGARTDKLADIYQLMSKTKSEVTINDQQLHSVRLTCALFGEH